MQFFAVLEEAVHHVGDASCPECQEDYPETCRCGGLMHAESAGAEDQGASEWIRTRCDQCGRAKEDAEEDAGRDPR
jgi:hypothetical protein